MLRLTVPLLLPLREGWRLYWPLPVDELRLGVDWRAEELELPAEPEEYDLDALPLEEREGWRLYWPLPEDELRLGEDWRAEEPEPLYDLEALPLEEWEGAEY